MRDTMRNKSFIIYLIAGIFLGMGLWNAGVSQTSPVRLWPNIEPFRTGELKVSDLHRIYYELSGNPKGKAVFVLHGGPGGKSSPYYRRYFNPDVFLIIQFDQRGCGLSKPLFELRENTTPDLVADIEKLRLHLKLDKIILFGGSWGTTLALAYAEAHPGSTAGMVLRGVFTGTREELDHYYRGVRTFFPEAYDKLEGVLGSPPSPQAVLRLVQSADLEERKSGERAWVEYEFMIAELRAKEADMRRFLENPGLADTIRTLGLIENHYMANGCFFEEGQLYRDAFRLNDIPTVLINGRYDMICPPLAAYKLHQMLPLSKLVIAEASGHAAQEPAIEQALLNAMRDFE